MNVNFPDREQGMRFGAINVCSFVNFNIFLPNRTPKTNQTSRPASPSGHVWFKHILFV